MRNNSRRMPVIFDDTRHSFSAGGYLFLSATWRSIRKKWKSTAPLTLRKQRNSGADLYRTRREDHLRGKDRMRRHFIVRYLSENERETVREGGGKRQKYALNIFIIFPFDHPSAADCKRSRWLRRAEISPSYAPGKTSISFCSQWQSRIHNDVPAYVFPFLPGNALSPPNVTRRNVVRERWTGERKAGCKKRAGPIDRSDGNFSGEQQRARCARSLCRRPFRRYPTSITQNLHIRAGQLDLLAKYSSSGEEEWREKT